MSATSLGRRLQRNKTNNRDAILDRVEASVRGVLERAHDGQPRIGLAIERWSEAVQAEVVQDGQQGRRQPDHELEPLPDGTRIKDVFNEVSGGLLILGHLGSGKTTALLEVAQELIGQARADPNRRMPVVFNLSSWTSWAAHHEHPQLAGWLAEELHHSYEVPRQIAQAWVHDGDILPLLDGLDDVADEHRAGCVEAINEFRDTEYFGKLVVCSDVEEYEALSARLRVDDAVVLQPLTPEQIVRYLQAVGPPAASVQQALVHADQSLWELVSSPLMLNIVTQVYRARRADTLLAPGTPEERRARLVAEYVNLERGTVAGRYTEAQTRRWLSRLARAMRARGQSEFDLDRLQPDWLPTPAQQRLVTLVPAIVSLMVGGVGVGLIFRSVYARAVEWVAGLDARLVTGLRLDPDVAGLVFGAIAGLVFALVAVIGGRANEPVRALRWPWVGWGGGLGTGLVAGLVAGPMAGLVAGLIGLGGGRVYELVRGDGMEGAGRSWPEVLSGLGAGLLAGLCFGLGIGLGFGRSAGLIAGLVALVVVGLVVLGGRRIYELVRGDGMDGARPTINPVEELRWSRKGLVGGLGAGLGAGLRYYGVRIGLIGLSFGLSGMLGGLLGGELSGDEIAGLLGRLDDVLVSVVGFGVVVGLGVGLAVGLVNGLVNGMVAGLAEQHVTPNEGIRRSRRHALRIGLSVGLIVGLISGLVYVLAYVLRGSLGVGLVFGPRVGLAYGLVYGLGAGLVYGLGFGLEFGGIAYLRHLALRALLVWNRAAPWHYQRFLDHATNRGFLRRSGGSYSFVDRFLLEYFAAADDDQQRRRGPGAVT